MRGVHAGTNTGLHEMWSWGKFESVLNRAELRTVPGLEEVLVLRRGQTLSVNPVTKGEFESSPAPAWALIPHCQQATSIVSV